MNMMEFATKNVYRNMKAYFAYFFSSTVSAALLFSFTMLICHPNFQVDMLPDYLQKSIVLVIVIAYSFLCFFVFYSVSIFLKSRYKEFGTLYIIGTSRKQIQNIIRIENIMISSLSSIIGILIGTIFSKVLLAMSGKLLDFQAMNFYFPIKASIVTIIAFIIIGIVIPMFCSTVIKEDRILELLKGTKKPKTEPKTSRFLAVLCIILLAVGYYLSITAEEKNISNRIIPATVMVIIGTYLLFSQLSIFIIKLIKKNRKLYMKRRTMLLTSNLLYRVRDNTRMFFLVAITSTVALTSIGGAYAYWNSKENQVNNSFPQSFFFYDINDSNSNNEKVSFIENALKNESIGYEKMNGNIKFVTPNDGSDEVVVVSETTYKELAQSLSLDSIAFNGDEALIIQYLGNDQRSNNRSSIKFDNILLNIASESTVGILPSIYGEVCVVKDDVYQKIGEVNCHFEAINVEKYKDTLDICKSYVNQFDSKIKNKYTNDFLKAYILESTKIGYGFILFSTIFIGLIFFVTTASFLYNKCYMDIIEDKKKYKQLSKIGISFSDIKKILNIEIGVLFLLPYIVAIIHFFFAISALKYGFGIPVLAVAVQIIGIILITQGIYYSIIRNSYLFQIKKELVQNRHEI